MQRTWGGTGKVLILEGEKEHIYKGKGFGGPRPQKVQTRGVGKGKDEKLSTRRTRGGGKVSGNARSDLGEGSGPEEKKKAHLRPRGRTCTW